MNQPGLRVPTCRSEQRQYQDHLGFIRNKLWRPAHKDPDLSQLAVHWLTGDPEMLALRVTKPGTFDAPFQCYNRAEEDREGSS